MHSASLTLRVQFICSMVFVSQNVNMHRLCVAPMMDWTDRHCRYFLRLVSPRARLYTEMITTGALMHGDVARHLDFDPAEHRDHQDPQPSGPADPRARRVESIY